MPPQSTLAAAVRSETAAPYAAPVAASPPPAPVLARIERAGPAALDDHELLGLVGVRLDAATLAAAGGLRELLDDPDDTLRSFLLPAEDRARVHALHELHARWMLARLRRDGALTSPATPGATSRPGFADFATRSSSPSSSTTGTSPSRTRPSSRAPWTAPPSIRAWWCAAR